MTLADGKYLAKVNSWGVVQHGESTFFKVEFMLLEGNTVDFSVSLKSEASRNYLYKNLMLLGFDGEDLSKIELRKDTDFEIVVENETSQSGKTWPRVKYVNDPSVSANKYTQSDESKNLLAKFNGEFAAAKKTVRPVQKKTTEVKSFDDLDKLPF